MHCQPRIMSMIAAFAVALAAGPALAKCCDKGAEKAAPEVTTVETNKTGFSGCVPGCCPQSPCEGRSAKKPRCRAGAVAPTAVKGRNAFDCAPGCCPQCPPGNCAEWDPGCCSKERSATAADSRYQAVVTAVLAALNGGTTSRCTPGCCPQCPKNCCAGSPADCCPKKRSCTCANTEKAATGGCQQCATTKAAAGTHVASVSARCMSRERTRAAGTMPE